MPTTTFENLAPTKRQQFIQAALEEFAAHNYDVASVNRIVKVLSIARGSVYQYFNDKFDLWQYLRRYAENQKRLFLSTIKREDYPDFWAHLRGLYHKGVHFDMAYPVCSRLLYRISYQENSSSLHSYLNTWKQEAKAELEAWMAAEQATGAINPDLSTSMAAHFFLSMSMGIADWLQDRYAIDENLTQGKPMLGGGDLTDYYDAIDSLLALLKKSLQP